MLTLTITTSSRTTICDCISYRMARHGKNSTLVTTENPHGTELRTVLRDDELESISAVAVPSEGAAVGAMR